MHGYNVTLAKKVRYIVVETITTTTTSQHNFYFNFNNFTAKITFQFTPMDSLITNSHFMHFKLPNFGVLIRVFLSLCVVLALFAAPVNSRSFTSSRGDEGQPSPFSTWDITGTYEGSWGLMHSKNSNSTSPKITKSSGDSFLELISAPTKIYGLHYVQGMIIFHDVYDNEHEVAGARIKVEGVYIWPLRQLQMKAYRGKLGEFRHGDDYILCGSYHWAFKQLGVFSSQVFQESPWVKIWKKKYSPVNDMEKDCNITIRAQISRVPLMQSNGDQYSYHIKGLMVRFSVDDNGDCLQPMLLNATSVNTEMYYNKAINYTLMVSFMSILQVLLLIRQREHSSSQSGPGQVSILAIGQQAIMDVYLCLLHLITGVILASICEESLFVAFATPAFFKFIVFSIFEMRYLLAIWMANRPTYSRGSLEATSRRRSVVYNRFYSILVVGILGGIFIIYEFHKFLPSIILILHSFWIPQIVANIVYDPTEPLHPCYIIGMSITRLAIPLYVFGCPHNFMRVKPDKIWCICLVGFVGLQTSILLLQHDLGSGYFVLRQILLIKYSYHRRPDQDIKHATDCVICMTAIDFSQPPDVYMVTPCNHFFHSECLQKWMDVKMVCPTCRRRIPPV